jgi:DNA polymerase-3 subunit epsilon
MALGVLAQKLLALRAPPRQALARRLVAALVGEAARGLPDPLDLARFGLCATPRPRDSRSEQGERPAGAARRLGEVEFVVIDLETTGLSPRSSTILEIGAVRVGGAGALERFGTFVDPQIAIPPAIRAFTGIDDAMVAGAPRLGEALEALLHWLARFPGAPLVAHNAPFDAGFLARGLAAVGFPPLEHDLLCTRRIARRVLPELHRFGLDHLTCHFGVANHARHRALGDAEATAKVLLRLVELAGWRAGVKTLADLLALQRKTPAQVRKGLRPLSDGGSSRTLHALPP